MEFLEGQSSIALIIFGFVAGIFFEVFTLGILRFFLFYTIVREKSCKVYTLFGKVVGTVSEPGLHFLWPRLTWKAFVINLFGRVHTLDLRMDQRYLRSQPVNSEEGAPMGIGIWYEMYISDPLDYLFKNVDPEGSLSANVSNATVRTLSNLPLSTMLENRRTLSHTVRDEVTQKSSEWGYKVGSVYLRKVHFRDQQMIKEIESKVVNRLRQVTASIKQDGENQVHVITNSANRAASFEFARAAAIRPQIVGEALREIGTDPEVANAMFEVLETQRLLDSKGEMVLVSSSHGFTADLLATQHQ